MINEELQEKYESKIKQMYEKKRLTKLLQSKNMLQNESDIDFGDLSDGENSQIVFVEPTKKSVRGIYDSTIPVEQVSDKDLSDEENSQVVFVPTKKSVRGVYDSTVTVQQVSDVDLSDGENSQISFVPIKKSVLDISIPSQRLSEEEQLEKHSSNENVQNSDDEIPKVDVSDGQVKNSDDEIPKVDGTDE